MNSFPLFPISVPGDISTLSRSPVGICAEPIFLHSQAILALKTN
uniref:Uncharacterized protein n=1 Tax=Rhizophora mucronata TaxID=61149 RepID=A0A2P2NKE2_RHIMU